MNKFFKKVIPLAWSVASLSTYPVLVPGSASYQEEGKNDWTEAKYISTKGYTLS